MDELPYFLDFEASSLSDVSHPIEVAWSLPSGEIESYLIRPTWDWNDWSPDAEYLHGLTREQITKDGLPAWHVAKRMNEVLADATCYTDAPEFDGFWLSRLFEHYDAEPAFELRHFDTLFPSVSPNRIAFHVWPAKQAAGGQHRAAVDVKYLQELYRRLKADTA